MKAFVSFQFSYCPLIWMNHSRTFNNKINRIYERHSKWYTMTKKPHLGNYEYIYTRNLHIFVTEMFKVKIGELLPITHEVFQIDDSNNYNSGKYRVF